MTKLLLLICFVLVSLPTSLGPAVSAEIHSQDPQSAELNEASKLMDSAREMYDAGKYAEGIVAAKKALEIRERLLPASSKLIDSPLNYLGQLYFLGGDLEQAKTTFRRLLERLEQRDGKDDPSLISPLESLATVHFRLRDSKTAENFYLRALRLNEQKFGANSVPFANGLSYLGELYRSKGEFSKSLEFHKRALVILGADSNSKNNDEFQRVSTGAWCAVYQMDNYDKVISHKEFMKRFSVKADSFGNTIEVLNGRALSLPPPKVPDVARAIRVEGLVVAKVLINEDGTVNTASDMCQGQGSTFFSRAAVEAALKARFSPTMVNGVPIKVQGAIVYRFRQRF